jgi:hypothetical protein
MVVKLPRCVKKLAAVYVIKPCVKELRRESPVLETEGEVVQFSPTDDGGVEVEFGDTEIEEDLLIIEQDHYANLAEFLEEDDLVEIGNAVIDNYEADKESREEWEQAFENGLDLLGLKLQETTEPFDGACTAVHPLLIESAVKFQSRASQELFPPAGPVRSQVIGANTVAREEQAQRVKQFMNYQLTQQMPEYFDEFERMLFHLPLIGSAFKKIYFDQVKNRPVSEFVPVDHFYVSYYATDLRTAERYTHVIYRSPNDFKKDVVSGMYLDTDIGEPSAPEVTSMNQKIDNIMGITPSLEEDPQYVLLEQHCNLDLPEPYGDPSGVALPYVVTVDLTSKQVLSIKRNYNPEDPTRERVLHFTHYKYVPGFAFYGLGLIHFLGNLTMTATTAMRSLVDAGQFANLPGGFKARGVRLVGDNEPISPGEFKEVESTGIDLTKAIVPLPYKEPSGTLLQMLQFVVQAGQKFADSTENIIKDSANYGPVGTTMALLDASSKFSTAIHKRMHKSQKDEFDILARINFESLPPVYPYEVVGGDQQVFKDDFDGRIDIIPVSDPNIPSSAHRLAMGQMAIQLASQTPPGTFNMPALFREVLTAANFPNLDEVLPPEQKPEARDPLADIMAASKGQPIAAFPGQNHDAHIQFKSAFLKDPGNGANPMMQQIVPILNANIRDHMLMKYQEQIGGMVTGVATDEQTSDMVMAEAAEAVANANASLGIAQSPEQQMMNIEQQRLQLDQQKMQMDALEKAADLEVRAQESETADKKVQLDTLIDLSKLSLEADRDAKKSLEAAGKLALESEKADTQNQKDALNMLVNAVKQGGAG